jgi:hypothetical protein
MGIGEGAELVLGGAGKGIRVGDAGVVDLGYMENIVDLCSC